jgi:hypothetical protein
LNSNLTTKTITHTVSGIKSHFDLITRSSDKLYYHPEFIC